jgi:hypothetical protein
MTHADSNKRGISSVAIFCLVCCLLAIAKMVIVSREEIVARELYHDDLWHILAAARGYWLGGGYTHMSFIHLPVYSLWIDLVYFTGVPLRIATEILFLAASFMFAVSLSRVGINKIYCCIAYCLMVFHPASFQLFNYTLAEMLYAPLFLLALAFVVMMWAKRGQEHCFRYAVGVGISFSLLWNLRKENVLILGLIFLIIVMAVFVLRKEGHGWRNIFRYTSIMSLVPVVVILMVTLTIETINYKKFGLFAPTEMNARGYTEAYKALLRIKPKQSIRFIPVTKETRKAAYSVSPAFKELEPYLERDGYPLESTRKYMGIEGEIAAGWFYWAMRDSAALAGHHTSARAANSYYMRIADEINSAIDAGRLPGRFVPMTFLDPDVTNFLPYLPDSFEKMWRLFTSSQQPAREKDCESLGVQKVYDAVVNRRASLTRDYDVTINGWAFAEKNSSVRVLLKNFKGEVLGSCETQSPRPDVAKSYSAQMGMKVPLNSGFTLQSHQKLDDAQLVFTSGTGSKMLSIPYREIVVGRPTRFKSQNPTQIVTYAIDTISTPRYLTIGSDIQHHIWSVYGKLVRYLTYLGVLAMLVMVCFYRTIDVRESVYGVMSVLLFSVITRVALFTLLDASSWPGDQARYLFPVMPVYSCFLVLFIYQAVRVIGLQFGNYSAPCSLTSINAGHFP